MSSDPYARRAWRTHPQNTARAFCKRSKQDRQALGAVQFGEGGRTSSGLLVLVELEQVPGVRIIELLLLLSKDLVVVPARR